MRASSQSLLSLPAALLLTSSLALAAEPDMHVARLLFEPVLLIDGAPAVEHQLVSFSAAEGEIPVPAAEQPRLSLAERRQIEAEIQRYLSVIGDNEATEGPYSDQLREDLFSTARLYQQMEDHPNALRIFQRTLNVSRINNGLDSLDQVEVLHAMAESYLAQDKTLDADAMMDAAYNVQQRAFGDNTVQLVPAQRTLGDWNTRAFMERSSILVNIPRMNVQNFMTDPRNYIPPTTDMRSTPLFKLYQARGNYLNAIKTLVDAGDYSHPELMELERKLLTNYLLTMHRENILYEPDFYLTRKKTKTASRLNQNAIELMNSEEYDLGKEVHSRRMAYLVANEQRTVEEVATAMLEEADWHLLFERKTVAADQYNAAYQFFNENPAFPASAGHLIYPALPVILPTYLPPPNSREKLGIPPDAEVHYFGYIDVSFELTKFGKARRIKQLGKGGEITRNMEIRMNQYLRNVLFRPRYQGTKVDTGTITLRYYVGL